MIAIGPWAANIVSLYEHSKVLATVVLIAISDDGSDSLVMREDGSIALVETKELRLVDLTMWSRLLDASLGS